MSSKHVIRFALGLHLDGRPRTDAGAFRRGERILTPTGHASWWAHRSHAERFGIRWGLILFVLAAGVGYFLAPIPDMAGVSLACLAGFYLAYRWVRGRWHYQRKVRPTARALALPTGSSHVALARRLDIPRKITEDTQIELPVPDTFQHSAGQHDAVATILGNRFGHDWHVRTARNPLRLVASVKKEPPSKVVFAEVADLIREQGGPWKILAGFAANREPLWLDFSPGGDLVNLGVSVGTGGGKSAFLRFVVAQFAYWGAEDFPVIDTKFVSLNGMEPIPGLRVYRRVEEQWKAIHDDRLDMDDRYEQLLLNPSMSFKPRVTILEEQNDAAIEWRAHWQEIKERRDPATPPVYQDITRMLIKQRQVGGRTIGVYQRMTAASCGGIDATVFRDAYGVKALSRFGPGAWDTLTGIRPRATPSNIPGRWTFVIEGRVRPIQVPYGEPAELCAFALSGRVRDIPTGEVVGQGQGHEGVVIGLQEAAERLRMKPEAFKKARQRKPITGEFRATGNRPGWHLADLLRWAGEGETA